jgi:predicted RNase H-like HicB family nuclease
MTPLLYDAGGYLVVVRPGISTNGDPCVIAEHPELQGCEVAANSEAEARELLDEARTLYLQVLKDHGDAAPAPKQERSPVISWVTGDVGGRMTPSRAQPIFQPLVTTTR